MLQIYRKDGMRGYFRGNGTNVIKIAPETAFRFLFYDKIHDAICQDKSKSGALAKFTAGSLAGVVSTILTFPFDLAKTKLSLTAPDYYKGMIDCLGKTMRAEGFHGWFNGLRPTLAGAIPFQGINQMIYNEIKEFYSSNYEETPSSFTLSLFGGLSTLVA
jgi:solute carrier family 25 phosphate transporter 23/24/25/41